MSTDHILNQWLFSLHDMNNLVPAYAHTKIWTRLEKNVISNTTFKFSCWMRLWSWKTVRPLKLKVLSMGYTQKVLPLCISCLVSKNHNVGSFCHISLACLIPIITHSHSLSHANSTENTQQNSDCPSHFVLTVWMWHSDLLSVIISATPTPTPAP